MADHFSFPFTWGANGRAQVLAQDSSDEIVQGVRVLLLTTLEERMEVPDFGVRDPAFTLGVDTTALEAAALEWDERAATVFSESADRLDPRIRNLLSQVNERED